MDYQMLEIITCVTAMMYTDAPERDEVRDQSKLVRWEGKNDETK